MRARLELDGAAKVSFEQLALTALRAGEVIIFERLRDLQERLHRGKNPALVAQEENRYLDGTKRALNLAHKKGTWTMGRPEKARLGDVLVAQKLISQEQLKKALEAQRVMRELDQRQAMAGSPDAADPIPGHEWFWRILAVLLFAALVWVGWVYYQIYPRRIVTDLGIAAGERARQNAALSAETKPVAAAAVSTPGPSWGLRLAESIETPITEPTPPQKPAAREIQPKAPDPRQSEPRGEKHELTPAAVQRAEAEFRRGAALLQQGRVGEAEARFAAAIGLDPAHERARQALAAMLLEQRRPEEARRLLQDGLRVNPRQQQFAIALARIYSERADYPAALEVLNNGRNDAQPSAEYDAVLGSVLSRTGRDREAVEAYRAALRAAPDKGGTWLGLALSLENLDRRAEAADAYRRALASGTLTADVRQYAEQKVRALR